MLGGDFVSALRRLLFVLPMLLLLFVPTKAAAAAFWIKVQGSVNFPDANPDTTPLIGPEDLSWTVHANKRDLPWTLTMTADDDLRSGSSVIPASAISWTGLPMWLVRHGTLSTVTPTLIAQGNTKGNTRGMMRFYLANSWDYNVGFYTTTVTFTLSSP